MLRENFTFNWNYLVQQQLISMGAKQFSWHFLFPRYFASKIKFKCWPCKRSSVQFDISMDYYMELNSNAISPLQKKVYQEHCYLSLNVDFKMGFCSSSGSKREKVWMYADFLSALWMMNLICISDFCCKLQVHLHSNKTNIPPSTFTEIQIWMTEII